MKSDEWKEFNHLFRREEVPARTVLLAEVQVSKTMYFIEKGCLRTWINNDGKEVTIQFFFEAIACPRLRASEPTS